MGNCCEAASSMEWDGEDWSDLMSKKTSSSKVFDEAGCGRGLSLRKVQKEKLIEGLRASPDANGKVKIKVSKKELAELLENQQQQVIHNNHKQLPRASAEQVLLRLIKARRDHHHARHGFWTPVLETIPEVS
ncbi:hypothetical protein VNO78_22560 [Psophocarpus tetragonolobus]|uniref:Uncharacterized protein n=1 Tax=Psophocarpus tetragonolobus TaxID=3891 RepID=A0AAN9S530_PSOTE